MTKKVIFAIVLTAFAAVAMNARNITVRGHVTAKGTGEPIYGVTIYSASDDKLLGVTAHDGAYAVTLESMDSLIFSSHMFEEFHEPVNDRHSIDVALVPAAMQLDEVVVQAKSKKNAVSVEPTELEVDGNYLHFRRTRVKIPKRLFDSHSRMIIQPALYNVDRRTVSYATPVVFDGRNYAKTQKRMYDWFKDDNDPLTTYQEIKSRGAENEVFISDSIYVENPNEQFILLMMSSLEDYNRIKYVDTFDIARGTVNPLRFMKYSLDGVAMNEDQFIPSPEVELCDAAGEMNLLFPVGRSELLLELGNNAAEIDALIGEFRTIEADPDMTLKSFTIYGSASPEGSYETNHKLASARMKSAMQMVLNSIDPSLRRNAEISSEAEVAPWEDVEKMLRADSLNAEADQVAQVLERYSNPDSRSVAMKRLPFYSTLLVDTYLPRLRRVNYSIISSRYRPLTDEEIAELYAANPSGLSKYQYYRLYTSLPEGEREPVIRHAVAAHPDFVVAATDLAEIMIARNENPKELLDTFFVDPAKWNKLPKSTRYNMAVACMQSDNYSRADSLLDALPEDPAYHKAKIYCAAFNGRYQDVLAEISEDSPLNEVLLLLKIKDNEHAYRRSKRLGNSAVEEYVKAVAANRMDDFMAAIAHLQNAIELDPTLRDVAKTDSDICGLLDEEEFKEDTNANGDE
ncbi:MAG: hypothetical protein K2M97_03445 [Muribaculaceae bacterium]|nr:hypothetical protein [Muribaculaceae bacterium]